MASASYTALPSGAVEASCPAQDWVIHRLSTLRGSFMLPKFKVDGIDWHVYLLRSDNCKVPSFYLQCDTTSLSPLRVRFIARIVDQQDAERSVTKELVNTFKAQSTTWGWAVPVKPEEMSPGLTLDDRLVLQTYVRVSKDLGPGSIDEPLIEGSRKFLTQACQRLYRGKSAEEPDVMLKLGNKTLPAHRALLAVSSDYFRAMFKDVAAEDMEVILKFIYGVLETLPEERLQALVLATDRLQVKQLLERCVTQLKLRLTLDNFAETAVIADRLHHDGLHDGLVDFAQQEKNRSTLAKHESLKRALTDAPDFAFKLVGDMLEKKGQR